MLFDRKKKVPIAHLRTRIGLFAPVETQDETGGVFRTFAQIDSIWCNIEPFSGDERFVTGRVEEVVTHHITMRWRDTIKAPMRFYLGTRMFDIVAVADLDSRRRRMMVLVEELKQ
jgi:SPP1 family predicted phage head-tail adaptor